MTIDLNQDCHMHTTYSDGTDSIDQMARSAIERGLTTIAITDHMPLPFPTEYAMDIDRLHSYRNEIETARTAYGHILTIHSGLEIEYIPRHKEWIREIIDLDWDLLLVSIHGIVTDQGHFLINGRADEFRQTLEKVFNNDARALCRHHRPGQQWPAKWSILF